MMYFKCKNVILNGECENVLNISLEAEAARNWHLHKLVEIEKKIKSSHHHPLLHCGVIKWSRSVCLWPFQYFGLYGFEKRGIEFPCWGNVGNLWKRARFALNAGLLQIPILKFPQDFFTFNFFPNIIQTQAIDDWFGCSCSSKLWVQRRSEGSMCLSSALCFSSQISYICPVRLQSGLKVVLIPTRSHLSAQPHWVSCSCSQDCFLSQRFQQRKNSVIVEL